MALPLAVVSYGLRHKFEFAFQLPYAPRDAIVQLALINIYNKSKATNMLYELGEYDVECIEKRVRVRGEVLVGDIDGYLKGFSYLCIASPWYGPPR